MPTYTFRCPKCRYEFTDIFPMKDFEGENLVCPRCKNKGLKQVFKGSFSLITKNKSYACPNGMCSLTKKDN